MLNTLLAVTLFVQPGCESAFRDYERRSLAIGARHGCRLLHAARLFEKATGIERPYELHLLSLPNENALKSWLEDVEYKSLQPERDALVAKSEIQMGEECTELVLPASPDS